MAPDGLGRIYTTGRDSLLLESAVLPKFSIWTAQHPDSGQVGAQNGPGAREGPKRQLQWVPAPVTRLQSGRETAHPKSPLPPTQPTPSLHGIHCLVGGGGSPPNLHFEVRASQGLQGVGCSWERPGDILGSSAPPPRMGKGWGRGQIPRLPLPTAGGRNGGGGQIPALRLPMAGVALSQGCGGWGRSPR